MTTDLNLHKDLTALAEVTDAFERSWSITDQGVEARVLFFCDTSVAAAKALAQAAQGLQIDRALLADWSSAIAGSDAIGLALRCDRRSVRLYTQYWLAVVARLEAGDRSPFPLYRGFKALPGGVSRRDDYLCLPAAPAQVFWPPMAAGFAAFGLGVDQGAEVFQPLTAESAIFTVTEDPNRQSWLTTTRRAEIPKAALAEWLAPLADRPGGAAIVAAAQSELLVHVAGGRDQVKGDFLTFYFETDQNTALASII